MVMIEVEQGDWGEIDGSLLRHLEGRWGRS